MEFWKTAIEEIYRDEPPNQPVSAELWRVNNRMCVRISQYLSVSEGYSMNNVWGFFFAGGEETLPDKEVAAEDHNRESKTHLFSCNLYSL